MNMASSEIEESSVLADEHTNVELRRVSSGPRSTSMSVPMYPRDPYVSYTGPLQGERQTPLVQRSGPLYISTPSEKFERPLLEGKNRTSSTININGNPSFNAREQKAWLDEDLAEKNGRLLKSGQLGMCNDPYCTTCPTYYKFKPEESTSRFEANVYQVFGGFHGMKMSLSAKAMVHSFPDLDSAKLCNFFSGDAKSWTRRPFSFMGSCVPRIMNPHSKFVQTWNKFVVISCLVAIFVDPLFFFLLSVEKEKKCITLDWSMAKVITVMRSTTDFIYFCHMLLQFRMAYVAPESTVVGAGELVDQPKKIALHYLYGYFAFDVLVVLPLPQILLFAVPTYLGVSRSNSGRKLLRAIVLLQYIPRFYKFLYLLAGRSTSGFMFETASSNIILNFFICALAGHVVGSYWYLFGLQRVSQCFRDACAVSNFKDCRRLVDCDRVDYVEIFNNSEWKKWLNDTLSTDCIEQKPTFSYGIYAQVVELTTIRNVITRYVYSFFWGFQQVSTLAGNQLPSYFVGEVLFTILIVALGSFIFALLVGNMLNFLQALMRGRLDRQLKRHNVEQWMHHRRLPEVLKRQVRQSETFYWAATRGVNEEVLVENLPEDLQREIRQHLFTFIKKVRMFEQMEDPIFDALCGRLRQKLYIVGSKILYDGGIGDKMFFIVRGKMISDDGDGNQAQLSEGDFCGEELLSWCLDHHVAKKDGRKIRAAGQQFLSNRTVTCLTNVETFSLRARDLEEVAILFPKFLRRVQNSIRRDSPYWRGFAATSIQVAWRYRKKRSSRQKTLIVTNQVVRTGFRSWAKRGTGK